MNNQKLGGKMEINHEEALELLRLFYHDVNVKESFFQEQEIDAYGVIRPKSFSVYPNDLGGSKVGGNGRNVHDKLEKILGRPVDFWSIIHSVYSKHKGVSQAEYPRINNGSNLVEDRQLLNVLKEGKLLTMRGPDSYMNIGTFYLPSENNPSLILRIDFYPNSEDNKQSFTIQPIIIPYKSSLEIINDLPYVSALNKLANSVDGLRKKHDVDWSDLKYDSPKLVEDNNNVFIEMRLGEGVYRLKIDKEKNETLVELCSQLELAARLKPDSSSKLRQLKNSILDVLREKPDFANLYPEIETAVKEAADEIQSESQE